MFLYARACWQVSRTFRDYRPAKASIRRLNEWLDQFSDDDRTPLLRLLTHVKYFDEGWVRTTLVAQNEALLRRLSRDGVTIKNVIYIQYDDAGSSSGVMLNLLKDSANIGSMGCHFIDGHHGLEISRVTNGLERGAVVYVDDFLGTGRQFCRARDQISQSFVGTFSEFVLAPVICEEALTPLADRRIKWYQGKIHERGERPLHENSVILTQAQRERLTEIALGMSATYGLGFDRLATMAVLYRNAPNTMPLLLRGDFGQRPRFGILPRAQDLPRPKFPLDAGPRRDDQGRRPGSAEAADDKVLVPGPDAGSKAHRA